MKAVDLSFDAPRVTPRWCADRVAEGYELLIVNLWTGNARIPRAEDALRTWRLAGGLTAAYFVAHDGLRAADHFAEARVGVGDEWDWLRFLAVDVEIADTSPQTVRQACDLVYVNGQRPVVYTSVSKWRELTGNDASLGDVPLWDASYGQTPGLAMQPQYGAWQRRVGHQYQNTTDVGGVQVDLNLFDEVFVRGGITTTPTPAQDWETAINVVRGWSNQMAQASKELADVADILTRLRPRDRNDT